MRLLVIGGTSFVGRHMVEAALARGHQVTLFNRGKTGADLFPNVEKISGDRTQDLSALQGRTWDAVLDTSGYVPRVVKMSAEALKEAVGLYVFVSTIAVYEDFQTSGRAEDDALKTLDDPTVEDITGGTYGGLKVLCERVAEEIFPAKSLIVRPGIVVGPYDPTDRFTYLVARAAKGSAMLVPGALDAPMQIIDARDLAEWTIHAVEAGLTGIYNAAGPKVTVADVLTTARDQEAADTQFIGVESAFLKDQGVEPGAINAWHIADSDKNSSVWDVDSSRAIEQGMAFRSPAVTISDTLAWEKTRPADHEWRAGLHWTREAELLQAWQAK